MQSRVQHQLAAIRRGRGVGAADLARRVGVSRQTIYAIEAGTYLPNTEVALRLARELEVTVEDLFSLAAEIQAVPDSLSAEVLGTHRPVKGQSVRIGRIGTRWIGVPVSASPYYLPEADGVIARIDRSRKKAELLAFPGKEAFQKRIVLAGCDPATSLVARMVEKASGVEVISAAASSEVALDWLKAGKVHIAGSHLEDSRTGEFNLPFIRREFPTQEMKVVTFASWEAGLVVSPGNPKGLRAVADLARKDVVFVNRPLGSGSRALLDRLLREARLPAKNLKGYDRIAYGHLAAAYHIVSGEADCCLATRSAAWTFGLDFVPLHRERYDLVMLKRTLDLPAAQALLDVLQRAALRRQLEVLAGYDTAETGQVVM